LLPIQDKVNALVFQTTLYFGTVVGKGSLYPKYSSMHCIITVLPLTMNAIRP